MKRRSFISLLVSGLCALGFMRRPEKPFRFFWVDEDTEIFAARDLESLNEFLGRGEAEKCYQCKGKGRREDSWYLALHPTGVCMSCDGAGSTVDYPLLTAANEGEHWGCEEPGGHVEDEETGKVETFAEALEHYKKCAWFQRDQVTQIATSYN